MEDFDDLEIAEEDEAAIDPRFESISVKTRGRGSTRGVNFKRQLYGKLLLKGCIEFSNQGAGFVNILLNRNQ